MRFALAVEYAGHAFCGFQSQPSRLRRAGRARARDRRNRRASGHGDRAPAAPMPACTRCRRSCISTPTRSGRDSAWVRGVNAHLPAAAAVLWAHAVPEDFHARFAATARHYTYLLLNARGAARRCSPGAPAGTIIRSTSPRWSAAAHLAGHARFLGVPRRRVPGEVAGQDADAHRCRRNRDLSCASISPPTHSCITWCATSSARWSASARARHDAGVDRGAAGRRATARALRRRSPPTGCISPARTTTRVSGLPPTVRAVTLAGAVVPE